MSNLTNRMNRSYYPFGVVSDMRGDLSSIYNGFDRFRSSNFQDLYSNVPHQYYENKSHYLISLDIPGVDRENIDIEFVDSVLKISASRQVNSSSVEEERINSATYTQSFSVPSAVVEDDIKATYENGVLRVAMPKTNKKESKKIKLSSDQDEGFFKKMFSSEESKEINVDKNH